MGVNKVIFGGETVVDLTKDTVTADKLLSGATAHGANGEAVTGSMPNNGTVSKTLSTSTTSYTVPKGYHSGSGKVSISLETKTATPTKATQSITPTSGKVLSKVTVNPIPDKYQDVSTVTATAGAVLEGNQFVDTAGKVVQGTMKDNPSTTEVLTTGTTSYFIPEGYHSGTGEVAIVLEEKSATPTKSAQTVTPTSGKVLSKVTVTAIPSSYITTTDATAAAADILASKTAYVNGSKLTGTLPNIGTATGTISTKAGSYTIAKGYHSGSGKVSISSTEQNKIISDNIKSGVTILGVSGKSTVVDTETAAGGIYAGKVMDGYVGYVNGSKITGTVADYSWGESVTGSPKNLTYVSNESGYATFRVANTGLYSNSSSATRLRFSLEEQGVIASNIVSGKTVLGVTGTASSSSGMTTLTGTVYLTSSSTISTLGTFTSFPKYILLKNGDYGIWGEYNASAGSYAFHASNTSYMGYTTTIYTSCIVINVGTPWTNATVTYTAFFE